MDEAKLRALVERADEAFWAVIADLIAFDRGVQIAQRLIERGEA